MISTTQMKKWPRDSATFCIGKLFWIECLTARHTGGYFSEDPAFSGYLPNICPFRKLIFYVWFFELSQNSLFLILKNALGFLRKISWRKKLVIILHTVYIIYKAWVLNISSHFLPFFATISVASSEMSDHLVQFFLPSSFLGRQLIKNFQVYRTLWISILSLSSKFVR